ncbi:MAG TPA: O-antigen ligase family protein [Nitrospira sp.]|nr:O-antigen ligase family protein [Nitrospira sp.]HNA25232.1 O-antigen ligase family protein [Nitrospira sp.]
MIDFILALPLVLWRGVSYGHVQGRALLARLAVTLSLLTPRPILPPALISLFIDTLATRDLRGLLGSPHRMDGLVDKGAQYLMMGLGARTSEQRIVVLNTLIAYLLLFANIKDFQWGPKHRAEATLGNPLYYGSYSSISSLLALGLHGWGKLLAGPLALGTILSGSRAPLAATAAGLLTYAASERRARKPILGALALVAGGAVALKFLQRRDLNPKKTVISRFIVTGDFNARHAFWKAAIKAWRAKPLLGWGLGSYENLFHAYGDPQIIYRSHYETWPDKAHNTYLDKLAESGVVGLGAHLLVRALAIWRATPHARAALVASMVQDAFFFPHPSTAHLDAVLTGRSLGRAGRKRSSLPGLIGSLPLAILTLFGARRIKDEQRAARAVSLLQQGRHAEANESLRRIRSGIDVRPLLGMRLGTETLELLDAILDQTDAENPKDAKRRYIHAGFLDLNNFKKEKAGEIYKCALELAPTKIPILLDYGSYLDSIGDVVGAEAQFAYAKTIAPELGETLWRYGLHLATYGKREKSGAEMLVQAVENVKYKYKPVSSGDIHIYETAKSLL